MCGCPANLKPGGCVYEDDRWIWQDEAPVQAAAPAAGDTLAGPARLQAGTPESLISRLSMESAELLQRCREGDELAWEMLVRTYQGRIYAIAMTYTGNAEEARDVAQDIFVRIWRRLDSCREPDRFVSWMIQIARNACVDHLRRRRARPPAQDIPADELESLAAPGPDPQEQWLQDARKSLLLRALQTLSKINREIILLKDMQGLALDEIASMLDLPLGTVKSRTNRARIELARAVQSLGNAQATP
jgi:RNA polymerase sigma-70 factor (ECF subfamily)